MKKFIFLLNLMIIMFMISQCKSPEIQSQWMNDNYFIEKKFTADPEISNQYLEEINTSIALRNNAEYFYIVLSSSDVLFSRKMKMMGLTVWIDNSDKKQKSYGVRHGGKNRSGEDFQVKDSFWESLTTEQKERLEQSHKKMQKMITVINNGDERQIPPDNSEGPAVAEAFHGEEYNLVFRIPIKKFEANPNASQMKRVMVGLELGDADRKKQGRMGPPMEGMPGGDAIGGGGMGRRGGQMRNPMAETQRFTHREIWVKVILAKQS